MAAIPITLNGVLYDLYGRTTQRVVFIGDASYTDLGVGGGPIYPPEGGQPPWPGVPKPPIVTHPIWPPNIPGQGPIIPPDQPPTEPPPPIDSNWQWGWSAREGWHPVYVPGDKPQPVPPPA